MARRKPRKPRPKKEAGVPSGYDSPWEYEIHQRLFNKWLHHYDTVSYNIPKKYEPDFVRVFDDEKVILIEAKGRFWDYAEYSKYIHIRDALPDNVELVFFFQKPYAPMPQAKKRRDGSKRTHAEWAEANDFRWFYEGNLPDEWKDNEL